MPPRPTSTPRLSLESRNFCAVRVGSFADRRAPSARVSRCGTGDFTPLLQSSSPEVTSRSAETSVALTCAGSLLPLPIPRGWEREEYFWEVGIRRSGLVLRRRPRRCSSLPGAPGALSEMVRRSLLPLLILKGWEQEEYCSARPCGWKTLLPLPILKGREREDYFLRLRPRLAWRR